MIHSPLFSLSYIKPENKAFSVVASKKVSKKAVIRNKNKRRVRHVLKKITENITDGAYVVFIKKDLSTLPTQTFVLELTHLIERAK